MILKVFYLFWFAQINISVPLVLEKSIPIDNQLLLSSSLEYAVFEDGFFILDKSQKRIFKIDKNGEHISTFGKEGRGPSEFTQPSAIHLKQDNLFIFDPGLNKILIFDLNGELIKEISARSQAIDMAVSDTHIFLYSPTSLRGPLVSKYDIATGKLTAEFGEISEVQKRLKGPLAGARHQGISLINNKLYVLSHVYDYRIFVFDTDGNLIDELIPDSEIFTKADVPTNFNPLTDVENASEYIKSAVIGFLSEGEKLYVIVSEFKSDLYYLEVLNETGQRINASKESINKIKPRIVDKEGYFYQIAFKNPDEETFEMRVYRLKPD